jgi:hypothetical protein
LGTDGRLRLDRGRLFAQDGPDTRHGASKLVTTIGSDGDEDPLRENTLAVLDGCVGRHRVDRPVGEVVVTHRLFEVGIGPKVVRGLLELVTYPPL